MSMEPGSLGLDQVDESVIEAVLALERAARVYRITWELDLGDQADAIWEAVRILRDNIPDIPDE